MNRQTTLAAVTLTLFLSTGIGLAQEARQLPKLEPSAIFKKLDADKDGKVSKEEFKKLTAVAQGVLKDKPEFLDKVFGRLDANSDGSITEEEFSKFGNLASKAAGLVAPEQAGLLGLVKDPEAAFKKLDGDKDGKLTKEEFGKLTAEAKLPQGKERQEKLFSRLDADSNGTLSVEEFKKLGEMAKKLAKQLNKADK